METRLTLRAGMPGTKRLVARYGERLVCVRYLYDEIRSRRLKTVELVVEEASWRGRALHIPIYRFSIPRCYLLLVSRDIGDIAMMTAELGSVVVRPFASADQ